jgi:phage shock protein C
MSTEKKKKNTKSNTENKKSIIVKKNKDTKKSSESESTVVKKLYLSGEDKMVAGVCGGIAKYLNIDAIWVRLVFLITTFTSGVGLIAYIIFWILVPENPNQKKIQKTVAEEKVSEFSEKIKNSKVESSSGRYLGGIILISIGCIFLFEELFWSINWDYFWPVLLIGLGVYILVKKED